VRNPNWTAREDATAAAMRALGKSNAVIGERLGRSADAVKRRFGWMKHSAERRAEIGRTKTRNRTSELRA
jgi:hypothetical protein